MREWPTECDAEIEADMRAFAIEADRDNAATTETTNEGETMTTTETAASIRKALKVKGIAARVRKANAGRINIDVVNDQDCAAVKDFTETMQTIDRCPATGEILCGGNLFIFVFRPDGCFA